jgi:hypothetical protein
MGNTSIGIVCYDAKLGRRAWAPGGGRRSGWNQAERLGVNLNEEGSMSAFGPAEDLNYGLHFLDDHSIEETLPFVSERWGMGVDFKLQVVRQLHSHREFPPLFRVLRDDHTWGDWHRLTHAHGHPIHGQGRALQFHSGGAGGETQALLLASTFEQHPTPHQPQHELASA